MNLTEKINATPVGSVLYLIEDPSTGERDVIIANSGPATQHYTPPLDPSPVFYADDEGNLHPTLLDHEGLTDVEKLRQTYMNNPWWKMRYHHERKDPDYVAGSLKISKSQPLWPHREWAFHHSSSSHISFGTDIWRIAPKPLNHWEKMQQQIKQEMESIKRNGYF